MTATIEVVGVTRTFAGGRGVQSIDLELGHGVCGLLGPNGAGKTTLLEVIATAAEPDGGTVTYWGKRRRDWPLGVLRSRIGFLPQDPTLPPNFRVADYLDYVAILRGIDGRKSRRIEIERVLESVDLLDRRRDPIRSLSGGMRQRVALARSLVGSSTLLILDEPTVGLDPGQRIALRDVLLSTATRATVMVSSHQTEDLAALCSSLVVLVDGQLVYHGTLEGFVQRAADQVWLSNEPAEEAFGSRRTADGRWRHVGKPQPGHEHTAPTIEDAYLLSMHAQHTVGS